MAESTVLPFALYTALQCEKRAASYLVLQLHVHRCDVLRQQSCEYYRYYIYYCLYFISN